MKIRDAIARVRVNEERIRVLDSVVEFLRFFLGSAHDIDGKEQVLGIEDIIAPDASEEVIREIALQMSGYAQEIREENEHFLDEGDNE